MPGREALVAGGGIGGLAAALTLAEAGFAVSVFERAALLEEFGAGLQLSPNATRILARFGILERLEGLALEPHDLLIRRARDGAELARLPLGASARERWGAPYLVVHRADLQRALLNRVALEPAISVTLDSAVKGFAAEENGRVRVGVKRGLIGTERSADLLLGADGVRSTIRERLGLGAPGDLVFTHCVAYRALIPAENLPSPLREPRTNLWFGPKAHLVHYPLRGGRVVNAVLIVEDGRASPKSGEAWNDPGDPSALGFNRKDWAGEARALFEAAEDWRSWPLFDRPPIPRWSAGPVTLIGDAAHPMLPFLAQGAGMAIEDAQALGDCLGKERDVARALTLYETRRAARTGRVQTEARKQAGLYHMRGPAAFARDLGMKVLGAARLGQRYEWIYSHRE